MIMLLKPMSNQLNLPYKTKEKELVGKLINLKILKSVN